MITALRKPPHEAFIALAEREPRLLELLAAIAPWRLTYPSDKEVLAKWYGYREYKGRGLKEEVCRLVGWTAKSADVVLQTSKAYDTAYHYLFNRLAGLQ
jgi:hypothetical protein